MIFFFDSQGNLTSALTETIKQGSNRASRIWFFMPVSPTSIVNAYFTLPNGEKAEPVIMTQKNEVPNVQYNEENYSCWCCDVKSPITKQAGTLKVSFHISQYDEDDGDEAITTAQVLIQIIPGGIAPPLNEQTVYTYEELMAYLVGLQENTKNFYQQKTDESLETESKEIVGAINELNESKITSLVEGEGEYSLVQKTGPGGAHGSSSTENKKESVARGRNAVAFGVLGESNGDCTLTSGYGAKAYEKGCVAFGTGIAGRTSAEWIEYYWDVENWTNAHYDNKGGVQLVEGDLPEDWQNKGIVQKPGTNEYYYVVAKSGSSWVKYAGFFLNPAYAEGQGTKSKGVCTHTQGYETLADADFADASGQQTASLAHHGHVGGYSSKNSSPYGFVHGLGLESSDEIEGQTVFGKYNIKNADAMFQVANGTGPGGTKNLFEILNDGRIKAYGTPKDDNDVVRLKDLNEVISNIDKLTYEVVDSLPDTGAENVIYLVPNQNSQDTNLKDEYMWIKDRWELIGSTAIDLTEYQFKTDNGLNTESKEIVGAINEVNDKVCQCDGSDLDVQINGQSIVNDGVANIPISVSGQLGVSKTYSGNGILTGTSGKAKGYLFIVKATDDNIDEKEGIKPIVPANLDYAVKVGITTNTNELTDDEKASVQDWIGVANKADEWDGAAGGYYTLRARYQTSDGSSETGTIRAYSQPLNSAVAIYGDDNEKFDNINSSWSGYLLSLEPKRNYHVANKKYVDDNSGTQLYMHTMYSAENTYDDGGYIEISCITTQSTKFSDITELLNGVIENNVFSLRICHIDSDGLRSSIGSNFTVSIDLDDRSCQTVIYSRIELASDSYTLTQTVRDGFADYSDIAIDLDSYSIVAL